MLGRAIWLVALVVMLAAPAAAVAGGRIVEQPSPPAAGPAFAGDDVVWAAWNDTKLEVRSFARGGAWPQEIGSFPGSRSPLVSLAASPERLTLTATEYDCYSDFCKYQDYFTQFADLTTGPAGGPLGSVRRCTTEGSCARQPCEDVVGASGHVALFHTCVVGPYRLHDFATEQDLPISSRLRGPVLAGDYVADNGYREVTLYNWRTNTKVLSVPVLAGSPWVALQADGTFAFADGDRSYPQARELLVASPADPTPKRVLSTGADLQPISFVGDRILYRIHNPDGAGSAFGIVDTAGREVLTPRTGTTWSAFDGRRLVGTDAACGLDAIVEWDLQGEVPSLPAGRCPRMTVARASRRVTAGKSLRVRVTCRRSPAFGCRGDVSLIGHPKPKRSPRSASFGVDLDPGQTLVRAVRLPWSSLCAAKRGRVTLTVNTRSLGNGSANPDGRWTGRITAAGVRKTPRACSRRP